MKEKVDTNKIIKDLETGFGNDPASKNKVLQLVKGLLFSDDPLAKKYISALDKATTKISKDMTEKKESVNSSFLESDSSAEEYFNNLKE